MKNLALWSAMHLKKERAGFHLLRPNGQTAFNFVHFLTPVVIVIHGERIETSANACIFYPPGVHQEYCAVADGFVNDFLTFMVDDPEYVTGLNLPLNEVFYIENSEQVTERIEHISWLMSDKEMDHTDSIRAHVENFLAMLTQIQIANTPKAQRARQTKQRFLQLREQVQANPGAWSVDKMAKAVYLTRSYFYTQYKEYFGVSPSDDLIALSIALGKQLLLESQDPVAQVARQCGYDRVEYFIRLFKRREGITPGQFRREHGVI